MRNLLLLLILISGLLAGYLIGDYRGKEARKALELAIETGKKLETERLDTIAKLEAELNGIHAKYKQQLDALNKEYAAKETEWRKTKAELDTKIRHLKAESAKIDAKLKGLVLQLSNATGPERDALLREIASLQQELANIQIEIDGNQCLKTRIPGNVIKLLNSGE